MIKSFVHKGLADFFASGSVRRVQPKIVGKDAVEVDYGDYH